jgi:chromosomal replication initiator protein
MRKYYLYRIIKLNMKKEIFDKYAVAIAKQFHLTLDQMFDKTKRRDIVDARQMLYYLCMERPIRISYIQRFMEEQGYSCAHSTIIHGYRKAKQMIDIDKDFKDVVKLLQNE